MTKTERGANKSTRRTPLDMDAATFRALGHRLVDDVAAFLETLPARPVTRSQRPSGVREALGLGGPLPEHGTDPAALLEGTAPLLFEHSLFNGHPRFFGYITSSPAPIGILGELARRGDQRQRRRVGCCRRRRPRSSRKPCAGLQNSSATRPTAADCW